MMVLMMALGLLSWLAAQAIGLGLTGAGHGWTGPFFFSMPLIILYPLAFVGAFCSKDYLPSVPVVFLAAAVGLDCLLLANFASEFPYIVKLWRFPEGPSYISLWLGLWAGWQILFAAALLRRRQGGHRARAEGTEP
jgi:hypothetical protein